MHLAELLAGGARLADRYPERSLPTAQPTPPSLSGLGPAAGQRQQGLTSPQAEPD